MSEKKSKIVSIQPCSVPPVIVSFQNALPSRPEEFVVNVAAQGGKGAKGAPLLIASSADQIYSGLVEQNPLVDNYLVIRNKRANKMRLVPYNACSVLNERYTSVPLTLPAAAQEDRMLMRHSIAKYGGKNAMRAQDRIARMSVNIDVIKDQLDHSIIMSKDQMKLEHQEEERLLDGQDEGVEPQKNYNAKTVQEVYNIREILTPRLVDELEEVSTQVLDTKPENLPITSDFLMDKFRAVQSSTTLTDAEKGLTVKTIIFADALRNLILQGHGRKPLQKISMSEICEGVEIHIRRNFADSKIGGGAGGGTMSKYTRRKAICHYLIVAILLTAKLEVATDIIIAELKLRKEELLDFARFLNLRTALNNTFLGLRMPKDKKHDDSLKIHRVKMGKKK